MGQLQKCNSRERGKFGPHKLFKINSDPKFYNKDIKRSKAKVRKAYNKRNLGTHLMDRLKQLSKRLLSAKKRAQETYLKSILCKVNK